MSRFRRKLMMAQGGGGDIGKPQTLGTNICRWHDNKYWFYTEDEWDSSWNSEVLGIAVAESDFNVVLKRLGYGVIAGDSDPHDGLSYWSGNIWDDKQTVNSAVYASLFPNKTCGIAANPSTWLDGGTGYILSAWYIEKLLTNSDMYREIAGVTVSTDGSWSSSSVRLVDGVVYKGTLAKGWGHYNWREYPVNERWHGIAIAMREFPLIQ